MSINNQTYARLSQVATRCFWTVTVAVLFAAFGPGASTPAQGLGPYDRDVAREMLRAAKEDIKKNYYDPGFRGIDLDARFSAAEQKLAQATSRDQLIVTIAQVLLDFNDSHTRFVPPSRAAKIEYGWTIQIVGEAAYVKAVKPRSDAEAKGLKPGDLILSLDGFRPTRETLPKMRYRYYALMPARSVRLEVQSPSDTNPRMVEVLAKITPSQAVAEWEALWLRALRENWFTYEDRFYESGKEMIVWQMPDFKASEKHIDAMMAKARSFKTLVLDLRGNGGGYVDAVTRLVGHFFDKDIQVGTPRGRKETKPETAKTRGGNVFKGQLIVLVDSDSASASEVFARVVQLEKRGIVIGDRTSGKVMTGRFFSHQTGVGAVLYYGTNVTVSDLIMADGKSLENVGVIPDEVLLPTSADMAANRDPVLSRAAAIAGVQLDPEAAGKIFPFVWKK